MKLFSAAAERNRGAILDVLRPRFETSLRRLVARQQEQSQPPAAPAPGANVLEVACGSGQHAAFLSNRLGKGLVSSWYPTDLDMPEEKRASIKAWCHEEAEGREGGSVGEGLFGVVQEGVQLDTRDTSWAQAWKLKGISHMFVANMSHISPWESTCGLMKGAGQLLPKGGLLFVYGPFKVSNKHISESNEAFDQSLRARDETWGVRDVGLMSEEAAKNGLEFKEKVLMPANNFTLVFEHVSE